MSVKIRESNINEIFDIENCGKVCLPIYYNAIDILNYVLNPCLFAVSAKLDDKLIGFICGKISDKKLHITSIGVYDKYRKKSVGTSLLNFIKKKYELEKITLYVKTDNKIATNFYKKNGFRNIKKLLNYYENYFDKTNDAYLMEFDINNIIC
jgi:ribosomal protein S18 acetylase RimI-like enzyme